MHRTPAHCKVTLPEYFASIAICFAMITPCALAAPEVRQVLTLSSEERVAPVAMTADGRTVAGMLVKAGGYRRGFLWTAQGGTEAITPPPESAAFQVNALSADGSTVVGYRTTGKGTKAVYWSRERGVVDLPLPAVVSTSEAKAVSGDGTIVAGRYLGTNQVFRAAVWVGGSDVFDLPLPIGAVGGVVTSMTSDGRVLVGMAYTNTTIRLPVRWERTSNANTGASNPRFADYQCIPLEAPIGAGVTNVHHVSDNGKVIGGYSDAAPSNAAVLWTADRGFRLSTLSTPHAVLVGYGFASADGKVIMGSGQIDGAAAVASLWSAGREPLPLVPLLADLGIEFALRPTVSLVCMGSDSTAMTFVAGANGRNDTFVVTGLPRRDAPLCDGDFDADLRIGDMDFTVFAISYDAAACDAPTMPASCPADFDHDGFVTDADFATFLVNYDKAFCTR